MQARRGARYLAPIALLAAVVALYMIVHGQLGGTHTAASTAPRVGAGTTTSRSTAVRTSAPSAPAAAVYTVQANDTYSSIAQKTGVSVARLEALNPTVSANALQTGQHLVLRRP